MSQGLSNPDGIARRNAYGTYGTPTVWFDGEEYVAGDTNAYENYRAKLDAHVAVDAPITVTASADFQATQVDVSISVALAPGQSLPDDASQYRIRAIVYQETVTYCCDTQGGNTFHHLGRAISAGSPLEFIGSRAAIVATIPLNPVWAMEDLRVVAFVEHVTGAILNASSEADTVSVEPSSWAQMKVQYR